MLDASALFFVRSDKLGDPFEGTLSALNWATHHIRYPDVPPEFSTALRTGLANLRRRIAVNCWHWNEHESEAMWKVYAHEPGGIAVKTNLDRSPIVSPIRPMS